MNNQQKDSRTLKFSMSGLLFTWIFLGLIRTYLLPQFANFLYFVPLIFFSLILLHGLIHFKKTKNFAIFLVAFYLILAFQSIHFLFGNITLITLVYGLFLYAAPLTLILSQSYMQTPNYFFRFNKIVLSCIPINLVLAVLQTVIPNSTFNRSFNDINHLTTSGGTIRAFGTFSSAQGLSIYLLIALCFNLYNLSVNNTRFQKTILAQIILLIVLNGNRTSLFYALFTILIALLIGYKNTEQSAIKTIRNFLLPVFGGSILAYLLIPGIIIAFADRISSAASQEDTIARFLGTVTIALTNDESIFGRGLGAAGLGTLNYNVSLGWIENDTQRVIVEAGIVLGPILYIMRFLILFYLIKSFFRNGSEYSFFTKLAICATGPQLVGGELFGQGSISLSIWLLYTMLVAITNSRNLKG